MTRRGFIKAGALGATATLAGCLGDEETADEPASLTAPDSFVETEGTVFTIDDQPVFFNGANNFWITDDHEGSESRIDDVFSLMESLGITLVRTWANGEAKSGRLTLQPKPGEHSEDALELHDYLVSAAHEHGIRLILPLVDNWGHEGGMLQYATWTGGSSREHFYTDSEARELYENHVETILTRENTYTGREYREEPAIAIWELANEPRLEADDFEDDSDPDEIRSNDEHRQILGDWIEDMSAFIKDLDDNHLVSTGSEGHYYGEPDDTYPDDDLGGQDYIAHHQFDSVDAASFHWYPDHWGRDLDEGTSYIRQRLIDAHSELGKPAYLGEFNVHADHGLETRNEHLEVWYEVADEYDASGVVVWQVVLDDTDDYDGFQMYREESGHIIEKYGAVTREKSG